MWELRFVSVHEDGRHLVLSSPDLEDEAFLLPLTEELRDAVAAPPAREPRPAPAYGEQLSPREIQTRVRAGESAEQIAVATGLPVARIERFAGPVLSERAHVADEARGARPAGQSEDVSRTLAEIVDPRLAHLGADPETTAWDSWRREDGVWMVQLGFDSDGDRHSAEWTWDPARRQLRSYGAAARALMAPPPVEPDEPKPEPAGSGRAGTASTDAPPGLRMVPARPAAVGPPTPPMTDEEAEALSIEAHPSGRAKKAKPSEDPDGVAKRAVVPSWDDIMFGVRRPDEAT
ncbi:MAG: hypothetical protein QOI76_1595 [Frankiales bacterium]|nr:hypothetical protein [Frankiales bacterium]